MKAVLYILLVFFPLAGFTQTLKWYDDTNSVYPSSPTIYNVFCDSTDVWTTDHISTYMFDQSSWNQWGFPITTGYPNSANKGFGMVDGKLHGLFDAYGNLWFGVNKLYVFNENGLAGPLLVLDLENRQELKLYPNPASNEVILSHELKGAFTINVYDPFGKLIDRIESSLKKPVINTSSYDSGLYFVEVSGLNGHGSVKFIKR